MDTAHHSYITVQVTLPSGSVLVSKPRHHMTAFGGVQYRQARRTRLTYRVMLDMHMG